MELYRHIMSDNTEISNDDTQIAISKDAITMLVKLVQLAQKKGAYSLDESYLAFNVINSIVDEPKFRKTKELVENLFNKSNNTGMVVDTTPTLDSSDTLEEVNSGK